MRIALVTVGGLRLRGPEAEGGFASYPRPRTDERPPPAWDVEPDPANHRLPGSAPRGRSFVIDAERFAQRAPGPAGSGSVRSGEKYVQKPERPEGISGVFLLFSVDQSRNGGQLSNHREQEGKTG